jgi:hypothetical protein
VPKTQVLPLVGLVLFSLTFASPSPAQCYKPAFKCSIDPKCIEVTSLPKVSDSLECLPGRDGWIQNTEFCGAKISTIPRPCGAALGTTVCQGGPDQEGCEDPCDEPQVDQGGQEATSAHRPRPTSIHVPLHESIHEQPAHSNAEEGR